MTKGTKLVIGGWRDGEEEEAKTSGRILRLKCFCH